MPPVQFPQTTEYALRAMAYLVAVPRPGEAVSAQDLAEGTGVPLAYLSKVLRKLVLAGLLHSKRGHGGGFSLARPPRRIAFAQVLEAVGYEADSQRCAFGMARCDLKNPCPLHPAWADLKARFSDWANNTTLADLPRVLDQRERQG